MPDRAMTWDAAPDWTTAVLRAGGVTIRSLELPDQALVSGDLGAFGRVSGMDAQGAGALADVQGARYALRLGRDRLLVVGALPDPLHEGWNAQGFALTATGGADDVFELGGEGLPGLLPRIVSINPLEAGPSALLVVGGLPVCAYRHQPSDCLRLHVERGLAVYLWTWLHSVLAD